MDSEHYLKTELYNLIKEESYIFDFLQSGSLDGLWYWDMVNVEHEWFSPRFKSVFGYEDHEIPNESWWWQKHIFEEDLPDVMKRAQEHLNDPSVPYDQVVRYRHKDGSTVWIRCRGIAIRNSEGIPVRMLGCHTDVTELKRSELKLKEQYKEMERLNQELLEKNRELGRFAFVASHDLQEPLRKVASFSEILQEHLGDRLDDEAKMYLDLVLDGTSRMQGLIKDLLEYSQLQKSNMEKQTYSSEKLFERLMLNMDEETRFLTLPAEHLDLCVHAKMFQQLMTNLIGNAIKYGPKDKPCKVEVSLSSLPDGGARVEVKDNGIGIDPEYHAHIFEIFKRLHRKQEYPGTGIGLALCKRIIELHDGSIGVDSAPGQGSTFWFTLPPQQAQDNHS